MIANSLGDALRKSCAQWADRVAMIVPSKTGTREITYKELYELAYSYAGALHDLGIRRGDKLCIYSENCVEWALLDWGCHTLGACLVPIYPTLPANQANYIVQDCEAKLLVTGSEELATKLKGTVDLPVYQLKGDGSISERTNSHSLSRQEWERGIDATHPEDIATIIYTSGTTGDPKGAVLLNKGFIEITHHIRESLPVDENDTFLSFLPLSHVYERADGHVLPITLGATIAYAQSLATLSNDLVSMKPTIMLCVPRFLEAMKERILDGSAKLPPLRKRLFDLYIAQGVKKLRGGFAPLHGLLDGVVGKQLRARTGGRLKFFVSGGMAMPMHVFEFFGACGIKVLQGYGLTETTSGVVFNPPDDNDPNTVGIPIPGVEVKIAGDGEILIRGACVMKEYFHNEKATAEAIDSEGWFHTGDVGEFVGKHLKITDRKKDILVLGNGKNVAPQPIEDKLRSSPFIAEAILFGDSQSYVGGLIVPDFERIEKHLKLEGIKESDPSKMLEMAPIRALIKSEVDKVNKLLADFEKVKKFELINAKFSVDTGELTPSLKVKRKVIRERYEDQIKGLFR